MRRRWLLFAAALALAAPPAFGNCEAGGYWIHTLAEYKPYEAHRVVLPYWKESRERIALDSNGIDHQDAQYLDSLRSPELLLAHANLRCAGTTFSLRERYVEPHELRLDAPRCEALLENLPSHGYGLLDTTKHTLRFTDALPIGLVELDHADRAALEAEVTARIPELTLYAETAGQNGERIEANDVVLSRVETTTVGFAPRPFVMAVAVLTLRNLDRLYPSIEWDAELGTKLRGRTIEYPVIFFRSSAGELRYVGDGSSCATYPVASAASRPDPPRLLGAIERFRLTGAFDTNGDGAPDLLEVNDRFTYLLEPDGRLLVVRVGLGC